jgi:hypothetical protein
MNHFKKLAVLVGMMIAFVWLMPTHSVAQQPFWVGNFWGSSTDVGTNLTYYVVPRWLGDYASSTRAEIQYVSMTSDKAGSALSIAACTNGATLGAGSVTNLLRFAATTHGIVSNDVVVVEDVSAGAYERAVAVAVTTTSITLSGAGVAFTPDSGDKVYEASTVAQIPCGNATVTLNPPKMVADAQADAPIFLSLDGTAACQINIVNGEYRRHR